MPIWIYIAVMALVTYLIRALPFAAFRKKITSPFIRSMLYYMPYAVLTAMTVPAIFTSTDSLAGGIAGFAAAFLCALKKKPLLFVAVAACICAFLAEMAVKLI